MKKVLGFLGVLIFVSTAALAHSDEQQAVKNVSRAVVSQSVIQTQGAALLNAARSGSMKQLRSALNGAHQQALFVTDSYGNNILHVARNKRIFDLVWNVLGNDAAREALLTQHNKSGELPMVAHILQGHEDIFLTYFPQTHLYQQLQKTTQGLQSGAPEVRATAAIEQAELTKICSVGNFNMWQRANALANMGGASATKMVAVRDMIGHVAPFLKVK